MNSYANKPSKRSVTVIGSGIIGICCAWHLTESGYDVTVIDSAEPGSKTSFGNAGCISPSHVVPFSHPDIIKEIPKWLFQNSSPLVVRWRHAIRMFPWLKQFLHSGSKDQLAKNIDAISHLMASADKDWKELIAKTKGQNFLHKQGVIKIFDHPKRLQAHRWALDISKQRGYDWQTLQGMKLQSLEPELKVTDSMCAAYFPAWQHIIDPQGMIQHLVQELRKKGVIFLQEKVKSVTPLATSLTTSLTDEKISIQLLSGKKIHTQHCVIACGVWSNILATQLDHAVPLVPKRGYHNMLHESNIKVNHPLLPMDDYFLITPMQKGLRIAGMAEFDRLDTEANYQRANLLLKRTQKYFPQAQFDQVTQWMGQRPMLPDSLPIISASPQHKNIFYAFGHGHYGLTQGPTTGRLIAELVSKKIYESDLTDYRFARFNS